MRSRASARVQPIPVRSPLGFRGIGGLYRLAAMLVVLAMVSGCGRFTFFYGFAEAAIAREVDYHLNLDQEEKVQVEKKIEELLEWHSATMLPRYATYLNAQAAVIERGPPSRAAVTAMITGLRGLLDELVAGAAPFTADILVDHTEPARVRYLQQRMSERLEERREEEAEKSHDERLEERTKRITSNFENLAGDMNEAQLQIVSRYAATTNRDSAKWLHTRANRQRAFTDFLSRRPDEAEISAFIYRILLRPQEIVDPEYKAVSDARWSRFEVFLYQMTETFTPEQRATLSENLRDYAAEMQAIARRTVL